ncbi:MAG: N-acetylmuramoyl-L-alanine amidase [Erysipelotrichales bacterium]|nr:N-acetylmuramoyl-L-alanine amidase [Erysipelotrichales bacterium]
MIKYWKYSILIVFLFVLVACNGDNKTTAELTDLQRLEEIVNASVTETTKGDLFLPTYVPGFDASIVWESSNYDIMTSSGVVSVVTTESPVILTSHINFAGETHSATHHVLVQPNASELFFLQTVFDVLNFSVRDRQRTNQLVLPESIAVFPNVTVSWVSLSPNVVTNQGEVLITHLYDVPVEMMAIIEHEGVRRGFDVSITILGITDPEKAAMVRTWLLEYLENADFNTVFQLPVTDELFESNIVWTDSFGGIVSLSGRLSKTFTQATTVLSAEIRIGTALVRLTFAYTSIVLQEEEIEDFALDFMDIVLTDYQSYRAVNMITGEPLVIQDGMIPLENNRKVPGRRVTPSPAALARAGFDVAPNDSNVLWITIHETGVSTTGTNAAFWNNVINTDDRAISWHYTVDEHEIFQHIPDNYRANHAGEHFGNQWAIGIEMAINADGNFEGALRMYAKLVAYLLQKHNLPLSSVRSHQYFSGRHCPDIILRTGRWAEFLGMIMNEHKMLELVALGLEVEYEFDELPVGIYQGAHGVFYWDRHTFIVVRFEFRVIINFMGTTTIRNHYVYMGRER